VPLVESLEDLRWRGAERGALEALSAAVVDDWTARRAAALAAEKG
jgi:hypothetical protein